MITILVYILFILSVAFAAGSIILSTRLRNRYQASYFNALLYQQVFVYMFGFYGIWGHVLLSYFLKDIVAAEVLVRLTNVSSILGLPFLIFGGLMLTRFARDITGRTRTGLYTVSFLVINFALLFVIGYLLATRGETDIQKMLRLYFFVLSISYSIIAASTLVFAGRRKCSLHKYERRIISAGLVLLAAVQSIALLFYSVEFYSGLAFIFLYFAGNSFLPVYMNYGMVLSLFMSEAEKDITFDDFCKVFEITPRESEIIREVCNGLSNKEISDKLFITLQTVKDHTHRIYIKTNVRSRAQLINLVKESKSPSAASRLLP